MILLGIAAALSITSAVAADEPKTLMMKRYTIRDVERNRSQPLSHVMMPASWKASSRVEWTLASVVSPVSIGATFDDPNGVDGVEFFPVPHGVWSRDPFQTNGYCPEDVEAGLLHLVRKARPGIQFEVQHRRLGKVERSHEQQSYGISSHVLSQVGVIRIGYRQNSCDIVEEIIGELHVAATSGAGGFDSRSWNIQFPRAIRADRSRFDQVLPIGQAVCRSARPTPEFLGALDVAKKLIVQAWYHHMDLSRREAELWRQTNGYINDLWKRTCDERWASSERIAESRRDLLGGVHRFINDSGDQVIAPIMYERLFEDGQGNYILTNDPLYRPSPHIPGNWVELKPKR